MYIALHDGGGFIFDPVSQDFRELSNRWDCAYADLERDQLVIVQGNEMHLWQGGDSYLSGQWRSKVFQLPVDSLMSCARVVSTEISMLSLKIFGDGKQVYSLSQGEIPHNGFRLPAIRATTWQIEVSGRAEVECLMLASSMQELM
ncbi:hypothetical protein [Photobacterium kishitanii]|uniref:hypothetical protein n=1 Tax=Photobacterium kishitanii TaxID=318456 RepID=UPI000AD6FDA5